MKELSREYWATETELTLPDLTCTVAGIPEQLTDHDEVLMVDLAVENMEDDEYGLCNPLVTTYTFITDCSGKRRDFRLAYQ